MQQAWNLRLCDKVRFDRPSVSNGKNSGNNGSGKASIHRIFVRDSIEGDALSDSLAGLNIDVYIVENLVMRSSVADNCEETEKGQEVIETGKDMTGTTDMMAKMIKEIMVKVDTIVLTITKSMIASIRLSINLTTYKGKNRELGRIKISMS